VAKLSTAILVLGVLAILARAAPAMGSLLGDGTVAAFAAFVAVGLAAGHLVGQYLGGPGTVLSLSNATRHPGVALAIAAGLTPPEPLVAPAILVYLLTAAVLSSVYLAWYKRLEGNGAEELP
jgi:BASS family bile acid:Na+ symporter